MLCYVVLCVVPLSCGGSSRPQDTPSPEIHQLCYQESSRSVSFSVSAASCKGIDSNCLHENLIMLFLLSLLMQFIQINSFEVRLQMLSYHIFESRIPPSHCTALHCTAGGGEPRLFPWQEDSTEPSFLRRLVAAQTAVRLLEC